MPRDIMSSEPRHWMVFGQLVMPVQCCAGAPAGWAPKMVFSGPQNNTLGPRIHPCRSSWALHCCVTLRDSILLQRLSPTWTQNDPQIKQFGVTSLYFFVMLLQTRAHLQNAPQQDTEIGTFIGSGREEGPLFRSLFLSLAVCSLCHRSNIWICYM